MAKKKTKRSKPARTMKRGASKKSTSKKKIKAIKSRSPGKPKGNLKKKSTAAAEAAAPAPPKPKPGSMVWFELMTTSVDQSKAFYSELFGWKHSDMEMMPGFNYTVINHAKQDFAGMMQLTPEHGDVKPHWLIYVSTRDVDATAQKAEALGGEVVVPPHDIPVGRWAMLKDPTGAAICIYKSKNR